MGDGGAACLGPGIGHKGCEFGTETAQTCAGIAFAKRKECERVAGIARAILVFPHIESITRFQWAVERKAHAIGVKGAILGQGAGGQ